MNHNPPIKSFADLKTIVQTRDAQAQATARAADPTLVDKLTNFRTLDKELVTLMKMRLGREPRTNELILGVGNTDYYGSMLQCNALNLSPSARKFIDNYIARLEKKIEYIKQGGDPAKFRILNRKPMAQAASAVQPIDAARIVRDYVLTQLNSEMQSAIKTGTIVTFWQREKPMALADLAKDLLAVFPDMDAGETPTR